MYSDNFSITWDFLQVSFVKYNTQSTNVLSL